MILFDECLNMVKETNIYFQVSYEKHETNKTAFERKKYGKIQEIATKLEMKYKLSQCNKCYNIQREL